MIVAAQQSSLRALTGAEQNSAYRSTPKNICCAYDADRVVQSSLNRPRRVTVNRKYTIALIGLAAGFLISFFFTQNYNKSNAAPTASASQSGAPNAAGGAPNQQAMMGQVQQIVEKAKSNPNDFQAQVEAAKVFNQVGRIAETADYLKKAYAIDPNKFNELGAAGFMGQYYFEQKNYSEAETWFNRAIKADPNEADLY